MTMTDRRLIVEGPKIDLLKAQTSFLIYAPIIRSRPCFGDKCFAIPQVLSRSEDKELQSHGEAGSEQVCLIESGVIIYQQ